MTDIAALILAAGLSRRMGQPKPLLPWGGQPLIAHQIQTARQAGLGQVWVVLGHTADHVGALATRHGASVVHNTDYANFDLLTSIQVGLRALPANIGGALVMLCDMPLISPSLIQALVKRWRQGDAWLVAPTHHGQRGHPVVFDRQAWPTVMSLPPDSAPRAVFDRHPQHVALLPVEADAVLLDMDTPDQYTQLHRRAHGE
jgi:molybdenum cofactor cytidylyltransferase